MPYVPTILLHILTINIVLPVVGNIANEAYSLLSVKKMIEKITNNLKSIALLEAIICPEWEYRCYSYNSKWDEGEEMASMRNGSGDEWFLWIKNGFAALKVMSHEFGVLTGIDSIKDKFPNEYASFISESAFSINESTSLWYLNGTQWIRFDVNEEEANNLVKVFNWTPLEYKDWAEEYYENELSLKAIENVMSGNLTENDIHLLNEDLSVKDLEEVISEIGYNR